MHYIKTSVPLMIAGLDLADFADFRVHYGHGGGYPWLIRLETEHTCHTVEELHSAQDRISAVLRHVPATWEIESLYYDGATVPSLTVRRAASQNSPNGTLYIQVEYGASALD